MTATTPKTEAHPRHRTRILQIAALIAGLASAPLGWAVSVTPGELAEARQWAAAKFEGVQPPRTAEPALVVLANHGDVQKNARAGQPLRIGEKEYTRGLFCHAPSKIVIQLPGPGASFTALVGLDRAGGGGSVDFSVSVGGAEKFRSGVMHNGSAPAKPVQVDLDGATEFVLRIEETPDGIACDQADWAEAKVTLKDGREIWLADLPFGELSRTPYSTEPPFSFVYGGKPSAELLKTWKLARGSRKLDATRTERTLVWTDPQTGLQVRCVAVEYADFPTVEWTLHFKNTGTNDTPILADIQAVDLRLTRAARDEFVLNHATGDNNTTDSYEPHRLTLSPKSEQRFASARGRPTTGGFPYFNIEWQGAGLIVVLGWPGQWAAQFTRDEDNGLRVRGGQELTHFKLQSGEEVRSPLVVLQFWQGDRIRSQNIWRRWMLAHNTPRPGGKPIAPMMPACNGNHYPGIITDAAEELHFLRRYLEEGIKPDYWWQDAGWYPCDGVGWPKTGTWEVEPKRWPKGIREVSDWCRAQGMKTIVWFEPERVHPDTWLTKNHPEWVLGGKGGGLLNLGNADAWKWLVDHIDKLLVEQGIDLYRQDFNMDPLTFWRANDAADRQGITEIRHVEGYLAYWDELLKRHPGMLIDSCASGGRRNDLETLRRAVPLLRSDYNITEPLGQQCHTYGLASWLPFYGMGFLTVDSYLIRSQMSPNFTLGVDTRRKDHDYNLLRKLVREWRQVADCLLGDFYPLSPYGTANDIWLAWQFDVPESGKGLVQVFRRANSMYESARVKLCGLDPQARYTVTDLDRPTAPQELTGRELLERGLLIAMPDKPSAIVLTYQQLRRTK